MIGNLISAHRNEYTARDITIQEKSMDDGTVYKIWKKYSVKQVRAFSN